MPPTDYFLMSQHEKRMKQKKKNQDYDEKCWSCRLTSGFGLLGAAGWLVYCLDKTKGRFSQGVLLIGASGLVSLGAARLLDFPPFGPKAQPSPVATTERTELTQGKK